MSSLTKLHRGSLDKVNETLLPIDKTGLVGYWPFWENAGTTAYDESKSGLDGTINGATWAWSVDFNKPFLSFDGVDDTVDKAFDWGPSDKTFLCWVKAPSGEGTRDYIMGHNGGTVNGYVGIDANGEFYFRGDGVSGDILNAATGVIRDGTWHMGTVVIDQDTEIRTYIDDSLDYTWTGSCATDYTGGTFQVGNRGDSYAGRFLNGDVHLVRLLDRALSSGEVSKIYNKTKPL